MDLEIIKNLTSENAQYIFERITIEILIAFLTVSLILFFVGLAFSLFKNI